MLKGVCMKTLILLGRLSRRVKNKPKREQTTYRKENIYMTTKHRLITILGSVALVACLALAGPTAHAQTYSLTDLGVLPGKKDSIPAAINNLAQVAGTSGAGTSSESAFRYNRINRPREG